MTDSERVKRSQTGGELVPVHIQIEKLTSRFRLSSAEKGRLDRRFKALKDSSVSDGDTRIAWGSYRNQLLASYGLGENDANYSVRAVGGILYSSRLRDIDIHVFSSRHNGYKMIAGEDRPLTLSMNVGSTENVEAPFEVAIEGMQSKKAEIEMYRPTSAIASILLDGAYRIQQPTDLELHRSYRFLLGLAEVHQYSDNRVGTNRLALLLFVLRQYPHLNTEEAFASLDRVRASKTADEMKSDPSREIAGVFQNAREAVDVMTTGLDLTSKHKLDGMFLQPAEEMLNDASQALRAEIVDVKTLYRFLDYSAKYVYMLVSDQQSLDLAQELRRARQSLGSDLSEEEAKVKAPKYFDNLMEQILTIKCR